MNKLIFLNGCVNSGKSTIGKDILSKCENVAFVELDDLHNFLPWMPIEKAVPINIKNGLSVSKNFIEEKIDVLFAYPLSDEDFQYVKSLIDFECIIECITLYCDLNKNVTNRGSRELTDYEIDRIKWMHDNGLAKPSFSTIVDTTDKNIDEVTNTIIRLLGLKEKNK